MLPPRLNKQVHNGNSQALHVTSRKNVATLKVSVSRERLATIPKSPTPSKTYANYIHLIPPIHYSD